MKSKRKNSFPIVNDANKITRRYLDTIHDRHIVEALTFTLYPSGKKAFSLDIDPENQIYSNFKNNLFTFFILYVFV